MPAAMRRMTTMPANRSQSLSSFESKTTAHLPLSECACCVWLAGCRPSSEARAPAGRENNLAASAPRRGRPPMCARQSEQHTGYPNRLAFCICIGYFDRNSEARRTGPVLRDFIDSQPAVAASDQPLGCEKPPARIPWGRTHPQKQACTSSCDAAAGKSSRWTPPIRPSTCASAPCP